MALYPFPTGSSGHRLATKVMLLTTQRYLELYDRTNLCLGRWAKGEAAISAAHISARQVVQRMPLVLLGSKVALAFGHAFFPFRVFQYDNGMRGLWRVILPHPSGRCREWNDARSYGRALKALQAAGCMVGPELP